MPLIKDGRRIKIPQGSPLRSQLTIMAAAAKEVQRTLNLHGVVEPDPGRTVRMLSPVTGHIVDLKVQRGDRIVPGQELAIVYAGPAQAYSADRGAASASALSDEQVPTERQKGFQGNPGNETTTCRRAETGPARSIARLCALTVPAEGAGETRLLSLRSPMAGSVIDLEIGPGTLLDESAPMMTVADLSTIWVTTALRKDTAPIATQWPVEVTFLAYPNERFAGEAHLIGDMLDRAASSRKVRIELPNPGRRLKPNMFASVTLLWPKEMVPVIPKTALIRKNETDRVFVEVEPWSFEARSVTIAIPQDDQIAVVSGLNSGERILAVGGALLED